MSVILKHTFKNIWSRPFRTIMLVICILFASFTAALAFDMSNSIENVFQAAFGTMYGHSDALIVCNQGMTEDDFSAAKGIENRHVLMSSAMAEIEVQNPDEDPYAYNKRELTIYCASDLELFNELELAARKVELQENEIIICKKYAEEFNLHVGDQVTLDGEPITQDAEECLQATFTIKDIFPCYGILNTGYSVLITEEGMKSLSSENAVHYVAAFCKIDNRKEVDEFCIVMGEQLPMAQIENLVNNEMVKEQSEGITAVFYFLFAISLLLVIFVTISLSERIMVERMSTIGTLRSLGISPRTTTFIVLLENALYGLLGGSLGVVAYTLIRDPLFNNVFTLNSGSDVELTMDLGKVSIFVIIGVILGTILVECFCPVKELLRAVKTPIRDIIFDNKDTAFKYGKKTLVASIVLLSIGVPCLVLGSTIMKKNVLLILLGLLLPVAALFLGFPHLLRAICMGLAKFFEKKNMPVAQLACVQASTKKASVGNARLCAMAVTLCLSLYVIIAPLNSIFTRNPANCDVVVDGMTAKLEAYEFIEELPEVTEVEYFYMAGKESIVGSERIDEFLSPDRVKNQPNFKMDNITLAGMNGKPTMNDWFIDVPATIGEDEIVITATLGERYDVKVGDELEIYFDPYGEAPVRKTFHVAGVCNSSYFDVSDTTFIINQDTFITIFDDRPYMAFLRSNDPATTIQTISKYTVQTASDVLSIDAFREGMEQSNAGLMTIFYMIMAMGIGLTLIAVISNQVVGFEGRKRECAVLISTAMPKKKVKLMFFLESLIAFVLAIAVAIGLAFGMRTAMMAMVKLMSFAFPNVIDVSGMLRLAAIFLFVFLLTLLDPLRHLRKMKTAEQLKYE